MSEFAGACRTVQAGFSVAISGTTAIVGAQGDDDNGTDYHKGARIAGQGRAGAHELVELTARCAPEALTWRELG